MNVLTLMVILRKKIYPKTPSKWTCNFCPFKEEQELCGAGLDFA